MIEPLGALVVLLALQASGLEAGALISAIAFLVGTTGTLAKLAWDERGGRLEKESSEKEYYRQEVLEIMQQVVENQGKQAAAIATLTEAVELALQESKAELEAARKESSDGGF